MVRKCHDFIELLKTGFQSACLEGREHFDEILNFTLIKMMKLEFRLSEFNSILYIASDALFSFVSYFAMIIW